MKDPFSIRMPTSNELDVAKLTMDRFKEWIKEPSNSRSSWEETIKAYWSKLGLNWEDSNGKNESR
jgi:hypothetical protein